MTKIKNGRYDSLSRNVSSHHACIAGAALMLVAPSFIEYNISLRGVNVDV